MTHFLIPFAVFPIASAMRSLDERVLLAAARHGRVAHAHLLAGLPADDRRPAFSARAIIVFVFALGFFVTPAILGGGRSGDGGGTDLSAHVPEPRLGPGRGDQRA